MGKKWDNTGIANNKEMWAECLRVLKPGGHLLAFSGTRTYHRMAIAIEDAGFEVRDMIEWVYGSGFPKSLNIGKAVARLEGEDIPKTKGFNVAGQGIGLNPNKELRSDHPNYKKPTFDNEYEGWGTALKPAHEPICMARKPLAEKTVAENCLKWGTGGINIDESRVGTEERFNSFAGNKDTGFTADDQRTDAGKGIYAGNKEGGNTVTGRFPANLIHDNSEEVRECFPEQKSSGNRVNVEYKNPNKANVDFGGGIKNDYNDSGNASRFFRAIPQVVDLNDFSIYNRSILANIKQLCGQHLIKKKTDIMLDGVIQEVEKFIQDAELLMSGNSTTIEKFLTDTAFITKTLIAQMTELKTLNVLPNWLITKFTEESEKTIKSLKELNTEDVKSAKSIFLLQTFISEVLENIRAIAEIVAEQDSNNGEYKSLLYLYQAKASKSERNKGCEGLEAQSNMRVNAPRENEEEKTANKMGNNHPTVKPIALMEYLIKMVTPKEGIVLDPFMGSGTTGVACKNLNRDFIGIELDKTYFEIAKKRIEN